MRLRSMNGSNKTGRVISGTCALKCTVIDARYFLKTPPNLQLNGYLNIVRAILKILSTFLWLRGRTSHQLFKVLSM